MNIRKKTIIGIIVLAIFIIGFKLVKQETNQSKYDTSYSKQDTSYSKRDTSYFKRDTNYFKVGVVYFMKHPSIMEGLEGLEIQLDSIQQEYGIQLDIDYNNAFGEILNIHKIIKSYTENNVDIIIALTTPCAKIAQSQIKDKPIIFVGVTDPVSEKLVDNLSSGKGNITGTTSKVPSIKILHQAISFFPSIKKVGIIYSTGESNSVSIIEQLKVDIETHKLNIELITKGVSQSIDIQKAASAAVKETDALFIINDNGIVSSANILIKESDAAHKPIFASDIESVRRGALFTHGLTYKDEGIAAANILKKILIDGKSPGEIPIFINKQSYYFVNKKLLTNFDIDLASVTNATIVE